MTNFDVARLRASAAETWSIRAREVGARQPAMPGYWADRLAYRLLVAELRDEEPYLSDITPLNRTPNGTESHLEDALKSHPVVGGAYTPSEFLDAPFRPSPFLIRLLCNWATFLAANAVAPSGHFDPARFPTLRDAYTHSVHFPASPAIDGPGFLDIFSANQQQRLVNTYGPSRIADFAIGLQIVHEGSHFLQTGDPLLEEFVLAALWVEFVSKYDYLEFQVDADSGQWCTIEQPFLETANLTPYDVKLLFVDTFAWFESAYWDGSSAYLGACQLTNRLDRREIRYATYLKSISELLSARPNTHAV